MNEKNKVLSSFFESFRFIPFALMLCFCNHLVHAQVTEFYSLDNEFSLVESSVILADESGELSINDVIAIDVDWQEHSLSKLDSTDLNKALWARVRLHSRGENNYYRYIAFENSLYDFIDAYIFKNGEQISHFQGGEGYPFHVRPIDNRNVIFPLQIDSKEILDIYFRLSDLHSGTVAIKLVSPDYYAGRDQMTVAGLMLYSGFMIIIFIYYTAIYLVIRRVEFISYSVFVLISTIFALVQHGVALQFLWPNFPEWALISDPVMLMLSAAAGYWFLREFCHLKTESPFFYWVLSLFIVFQVILIGGFVLLDEGAMFNLAIRAMIPGIICAVIVVVMLAIKGAASAKSFALAWLFMSVGVLAQIFSSIGIIERNVFTNNGFMIGNVFYVLILSFSLARLVQEMESERIHAISMSKTKSEFFAKMSHELRTPIHGVLGLVELLADTPMSEFQKRYIKLINVTGKSLLSVVNDLLDYSKIEAGEMRLNQQVFSIKDLTEEVAAIFSHNYKYGDVPLRIDVSELGSNTVFGDKEKIKQVLLNLLSNAFKFTKEGYVELTVGLESVGQQCYLFAVRDTGVGIVDSDKAHLFDAFYQVNKHQSGDVKGTGLGLAICQQMAQLMGGVIEAESELNKGATFTLKIPLESSVAEQAIDSVAAQGTDEIERSLNILVAEDNITNQIVMQGMLKKLGHKITIVENGHDAIQVLNLEDNSFDLVLMDHDMPVMNGVDATIALRKSSGKNRDIMVVAMTAHNSEEIKSECLAAGMNDFLSKPLSLNQLDRKLMSIIQGQ